MGARKKLWVQIAKGKAKLNGDKCSETTNFTRRNRRQETNHAWKKIDRRRKAINRNWNGNNLNGAFQKNLEYGTTEIRNRTAKSRNYEIEKSN